MILNGGPRVFGSLLTYPLRRVQSASEGLPYLLTPCLLKLNFIASNLHTLQPPCASRLPPLRLNLTLVGLGGQKRAFRLSSVNAIFVEVDRQVTWLAFKECVNGRSVV